MSAGHQGQRGGTGAGVDATDPGHHAHRAGHAVRRLGVPIGRPAQPAELAPPYVFLASQESSYVSGQVLGVTGGTPLS